jgi:hypothetical protein
MCGSTQCIPNLLRSLSTWRGIALLTSATGFLTFLLVPGFARGVQIDASVSSDPANSDLASYAERARREFNVPGLAIAAAVAKQGADGLPGAKASRPLSSYVGTYRDAWYGDIEVSLIDRELRIRFARSPRLLGSLLPRRPDTFRARWDDRSLDADALIEFTADESGHMTAAKMRRASPRTARSYDYQDLRLVRAGANLQRR